MWQERLSEFVTLFIVVNPISALPVFLAVTQGFDVPARRRVALIAVLAAFAVLVLFIVGGGFVLEKMGISLRSFQIAGGIVLFLVALENVEFLFRERRLAQQLAQEIEQGRQFAALALPAEGHCAGAAHVFLAIDLPNRLDGAGARDGLVVDLVGWLLRAADDGGLACARCA